MSAAPPPAAEAQEVHVLSTLGLMGVIRELAARFEQPPGPRIIADFAPTAKLLERGG